MIELKPCPFCGGKPRRISARYNPYGACGSKDAIINWYSVRCTVCKAMLPDRTYRSAEHASAAWNRRTDE